MFIRVSVIPYRSMTRRPVAAAIRSWSCTGSAADPDTSSRALARAFASAGSSGRASAIRWYIVGTPNSIVAPSLSSRATPAVFEPTQMPYGSAAAQRAEDAQDQAVHMEERQPVHEDVVAGPLPGVRERVEGGGDGPARDDGALGRAGGAGGVDDEGGGLGGARCRATRPPCRVPSTAASTSTSMRSNAASAGGSSAPGAASTSVGALSDTMCPSSLSPDFGLSGTAGTPASSAATTPTAVSRVGVAHTATRPASAIRRPAVRAAAASSP